MRRWLLNLSTAVSLALCVAACGLWAWSHHAELHYGAAGAYYPYRPSAAIDQGRLYVAWPEEDVLSARPPAARFGTADAGASRRVWGPPQRWMTGSRMFYSCRGPDVLVRFVAVPLWAIAGPLLIAPLCRVAARVSPAARTRPGRCRSCGYDLRATPGRCPECGSAAVKPLAHPADFFR